MSLFGKLARRFLTITLVYTLALYGVLLAPSRAHSTGPAYDLLSVICSQNSSITNDPASPDNGAPHQHCDLCVLCAGVSVSALASPALPGMVPDHAAPAPALSIIAWDLPPPHLTQGWASSHSARAPPLRA